MAKLLRILPRSLNLRVCRLPGSRPLTTLTFSDSFLRPVSICSSHVRGKSKKGGKDKKEVSSLVQPVPLSPVSAADTINVGAELSGKLDKGDLIKWLNEFFRKPEIKVIAAENGIDSKLFHQAYVSFRRYCAESDVLPVELHITLSDIVLGNRHVDDLLPYFLEHARTIFPHLECMDDLKKISDLRQPANWYPEARSIQRKIIFHAGPTNSGKTYHALNRFTNAKTGVYCGPLRLLANEVFRKTNEGTNKHGTTCDLVTGEERRFMSGEDEPSSHVACTVEMTSVTSPYEVAVIDEIQMMRDPQRGWAWTRALLGICAFEVHVCGEASAIDMVKMLAETCGDEFEVRRYKRLTPLKVLEKPLGSFNNIRPGDCIVCFNKNDIYHCSRQLEKLGIEAAVIYGTLPPGTKIAQSEKFNDPEHPCKVLVSTDAIGMGLNLNIKRIIFYSMMKPSINKKGEKEMAVIPPSTGLQIAGRAGRYNTTWEEGEVTTFKASHLPILQRILRTNIEPIEQAGLHPTAEQIELFAYHLPNATLANLIDIFVTLCSVDSDKYFMCNVDDFKFLAEMIEHVPLQLRVRYVFCCAPISRKHAFVCTMYLKFAKRYSRGEPITLDWLCRQLAWPFPQARTIADLVHLESVFDVLDNYLWLSYRFADMFPDAEQVREMQKDLDELIQNGIFNITKLLRNSEAGVTSGTPDDEDEFEMKSKSFRRQFNKHSEDEFNVIIEDHEEEEAQRRPRNTNHGKLDDDNSAKDSLSSGLDPRLMRRKFSMNPASGFEDDSKGISGKKSFSERFKLAQDAYKSRLSDNNHEAKTGKRLTDHLLEQGLLTEDMLRKLQEEFAESESDGQGDKKRKS